MSEESKKVYLITSGEYSDYGVDMICSTREGAERALELYFSNRGQYDRASIEEWDMDVRKPVDMIPCWFFWYNMKTDSFDRLDQHHYQPTGIINYIERTQVLIGSVMATNEEHAKKKIYDMVAKKKAELAEIT